jgi:hypothetical protein
MDAKNQTKRRIGTNWGHKIKLPSTRKKKSQGIQGGRHEKRSGFRVNQPSTAPVFKQTSGRKPSWIIESFPSSIQKLPGRALPRILPSCESDSGGA